MALTQENVAKLPSDGSPFFSSHSGTITPKPVSPASTYIPRPNIVVLSVGASPSVRLRQAKDSVYFYMRQLCILSVEGHRIVRSSELYMTTAGDVCFRKRCGHEQDMENPDYWEAKARFFQEQFEPLYRAKYPRFVVDPNGPAAIEQDEMDRACFRWERRKKFIEEWRSVIGEEDTVSQSMDNNSPPQLPMPHSISPCYTKSIPSIPQTHLEEAPVAVATAPKGLKRKRSSLEHEDQRPGSKRRIQEHACQKTATEELGENAKTQRTRKRAPQRSINPPVTLRRSARIAALPKIKYPR
ncbi:hypothetical protein F5Y07DRAFT_382763 [Xylaria sp. FL0933]|nr:hypothetical protein F5Y07DRAFT_382763 [Xylaria sp. FL0933]